MTLTNKFQQARHARTILSHGKTVTKKFKNVFVSMHGNMQQNSPRIPSVTIRFSRAKRTAVKAICNGGVDIAFISRQFYCKAPYTAKKPKHQELQGDGRTQRAKWKMTGASTIAVVRLNMFDAQNQHVNRRSTDSCSFCLELTDDTQILTVKKEDV